MTDLPHVIVGQPVSEEHTRVLEAYLREHDLPATGVRINIAVLNQAIDWWNVLGPEEGSDAAH